MKSRIHIHLPVSSLEESVKFYTQVFQLEPTKLKADYANFRLEEPALHLALVARPGYGGVDPAFDFGQHFGVELFDDDHLSQWKTRLKQQGILPHLEEEGVTCCYAVADKFWLQDPDGHSWEFWVRHDDDGKTLEAVPSQSTCCAPAQTSTSCC